MGARNLEFALSLPLFVWSQIIRHQDLIVWESLVHVSAVDAAHIIRDHLINCGSGTGCIPLPIHSRLICFLGPILVEVLQRQNKVLRLYFWVAKWNFLFLLWCWCWCYTYVGMFVLHFNHSSTVRMTSLTGWLTPVGKFIETTHAPAGHGMR